MRIVWTEDMDRRLGDWLVEKYGVRTPDPDIVTWREAEALFEGAKSSYIRKRYMGVVSALKRTPLSEEEAAKLIECVEKYGFSWEDMARSFEGRTGLYLKNYYYTAMRRHIRRMGGLKYSSKRQYPTIDAYFDRMQKERPEMLSRPGRVKRKAIDATDATDATDAVDSSDATDVSDASDATDATDAVDSSDATDASDATDVSDAVDASNSFVSKRSRCEISAC